MRKILLKLSFCGTGYCGYQVQNNGITVQKCVQDAAEKIFGERPPVTGCSRTDSGVHAREFYCTLELSEKANVIPTDKIYAAMNSALPNDISVHSAEEKDGDFHPRYSVVYKEYEYLIWNNRIRDPFSEKLAFHYPKKLDIEAMNEAAQKFVGKHDFAGFMSSGSDVADTVREIKYFTVSGEAGGFVRFNVAADGFLYNMVRILSGTLIAVSEGKLTADSVPSLIESKDRSKAGATLPPHGLYLNKVVY